MKAPNRHRAYWAFLGHRLSGLALGLFLPLHFYVLALALEEGQRLDRWLAYAEIGAVKWAEAGLVVLLVLHLSFGLRLLALELLPWRNTHDARLGWIAAGGVLSLAVGLVFLAGVF